MENKESLDQALPLLPPPPPRAVAQIRSLESALSAAASRVFSLQSDVGKLENSVLYARIAAESTSPVPRGIQNVGNTCYASAMLQALLALNLSAMPLLSRSCAPWLRAWLRGGSTKIRTKQPKTNISPLPEFARAAEALAPPPPPPDVRPPGALQQRPDFYFVFGRSSVSSTVTHFKYL